MPRNKVSEFDKKLRATIAANLKKYSATITQGQLSDMTGIPASTISGYFAERSTPNAGQVQKLADALGVDKSDIDPRFASNSFPAAPRRKGVKIPVLGTVAAGVPIEAVENIIGYEEIPENMARMGTFYALKISGDSMEPTMFDGDTIIVLSTPTADTGDIAVVLVNGDEATVKEIHRAPEGVTLIGHNASVYKPHFYSNEQVGTLPVVIRGVVYEVKRELKKLPADFCFE